MILGHIELTHSVDCRVCGATVEGGTEKRMYARLALHVWRRHNFTTRELVAALWQLARMRGAR